MLWVSHIRETYFKRYRTATEKLSLSLCPQHLLLCGGTKVSKFLFVLCCFVCTQTNMWEGCLPSRHQRNRLPTCRQSSRWGHRKEVLECQRCLLLSVLLVPCLMVWQATNSTCHLSHGQISEGSDSRSRFLGSSRKRRTQALESHRPGFKSQF